MGNAANSVHPTFKENLKFSTIRRPNPSGAMCFVGEQSVPEFPSQANCSIDDGYIALEQTVNNRWRNVPASRHGNKGLWSYAYGHAASFNWLEPDTHTLQGDRTATAKPGHRDLRAVRETI